MDPFLHILYFSHSFLLPKKAVLLLLFFHLALSIFLKHNVLTVIERRQSFHEIYCPLFNFFSMKNKGLMEERCSVCGNFCSTVITLTTIYTFFY